MESIFDSQLMLHVLDGAFHVSTADNRGPEIDLELWRKLPEDLLWEVLQKLPYYVKSRFGTVSKSWHSRLLSEESLRSSAARALPSPSPLLCCLEYIEDRVTHCHSEILHRHGSSRCKVYELDLSFLPEECLGWCWNDFFVQDGLMGFLGGTYADHDPVHTYVEGRYELSSFGICLLNPMTRTWRKLPTLSLEDAKLAWAVVDEKEICRVVVRGQDWRVKLQVDQSSIISGKVQFELLLLLPGSNWDLLGETYMSVSAICRYSSVADKWTVTKLDDDGPYIYDSRALCGEFIYTSRDEQWLTKHSLRDGKLCGEYATPTLPTGQMGRDLGAYWLRRSYNCPRLLVEHQGDLLCVQHIPTKIMGCPTFRIWKLDPISMRWSELTTVPRIVLDQFLARIYRSRKRPYNLFSVEAVGEFVCLHMFDQLSELHVLAHALVCHIPTKRWSIGFNNLERIRLERTFKLLKPRLDIFL